MYAEKSLIVVKNYTLWESIYPTGDAALVQNVLGTGAV